MQRKNIESMFNLQKLKQNSRERFNSGVEKLDTIDSIKINNLSKSSASPYNSQNEVQKSKKNKIPKINLNPVKQFQLENKLSEN